MLNNFFQRRVITLLFFMGAMLRLIFPHTPNWI